MSLADLVICTGTATTVAAGTAVYTNPKIPAGAIVLATFGGGALGAGATACAIVPVVVAGTITFNVCIAATLALVAVAGLPINFIVLNPNFVSFQSS
jgi:hypothetical protein